MVEPLRKQLDSPGSQNLVYSSAGKHAQVRRWLKGRKDFDLWINAYDQNASLQGYADYYTKRKGGKFPNLHYAMTTWPELFERYRAIYVSDDDLHISGSSISTLFKIREEYDLYVLQPAFNQTGKLSHLITRACLFSFLRYTNFVEVTCPLFRLDKLKDFMKVYDPKLIGFGVDFWYMNHIVGMNPKRAAVVDAIQVYNPPDSRKGGREISRLQSDEKRLAIWEAFKSSRNLSETSPLVTWSVVRKLDNFSFFLSTFKTIISRILSRIQRRQIFICKLPKL